MGERPTLGLDVPRGLVLAAGLGNAPVELSHGALEGPLGSNAANCRSEGVEGGRGSARPLPGLMGLTG